MTTSNNDWNTVWDQEVDYSGLMFTKLGYGATTPTSQVTSDNNKNEYQVVLEQSDLIDGIINKLWTLLDSQYTVDVFSNGKFLKHTHKVKTSLGIFSTRGISTTDLIAFREEY